MAEDEKNKNISQKGLSRRDFLVTGGPGGKQACVEACPAQAIRFVSEMTDQEETEGYDVNLRNDHWYNLGLADSSETVPKMSLDWLKMEGGEE